MRSIQVWFNEYQSSHLNPINEGIHYICVPAIMWSLLGILWNVKLSYYSLFNLATVISGIGLVYYFVLSWRLALGMSLITALMLFVCKKIEQHPTLSLLYVSLFVFTVAWIGQFIGHKIEGRKPSFFKDLQFLLIGPIWVLSHVYSALKWRW